MFKYLSMLYTIDNAFWRPFEVDVCCSLASQKRPESKQVRSKTMQNKDAFQKTVLHWFGLTLESLSQIKLKPCMSFSILAKSGLLYRNYILLKVQCRKELKANLFSKEFESTIALVSNSDAILGAFGPKSENPEFSEMPFWSAHTLEERPPLLISWWSSMGCPGVLTTSVCGRLWVFYGFSLCFLGIPTTSVYGCLCVFYGSRPPTSGRLWPNKRYLRLKRSRKLRNRFRKDAQNVFFFQTETRVPVLQVSGFLLFVVRIHLR